MSVTGVWPWLNSPIQFAERNIVRAHMSACEAPYPHATICDSFLISLFEALNELETRMDWKLVAPDIDRLLLSFSRGYKNPSAQTRKVLEALDRLLGELADLKPLTGNGEVKSIWLKIPRGTLDDFGDYDELLAEGEVSSHEDYVGLWKSEYPDDYSWYELVVVENEHCRAVSVGSVMVLCADSNQKPADFDWLEEHAVILLDLLVHSVRKSMRELREGSYNATVAEQLPYFLRTGVVSRAVVWAAHPEDRDAVFNGMDGRTYATFCEYATADAEDADAIGRLASMTGNDFLAACALGYEACGYDVCGNDGERLLLDELYIRYADGRDEGLTGKGSGLFSGPGIDLSSPEAWEAWFFDRTRRGGHPWEVCRGGNSTHVSLVVCHDRWAAEFRRRAGELSDEEFRAAERSWGYYYVVAGKAWNRSVEAVHFYVALKRAGLPVVLRDARAILARFKGEDVIGVVPRDVIPVYCESMFPKSHGTILDFMHVYDGDMVAFGDKIEWLPEHEAKLTCE